MPKRKGVFIGAYVPPDTKKALQQEARGKHKTLSALLIEILDDHVKAGKQINKTERKQTSGK